MRRTDIQLGSEDWTDTFLDPVARSRSNFERRPSSVRRRSNLVRPVEPHSIETLVAIKPYQGPKFTPKPMDFGFRFQTARPGDSISKLLGSSNPGAIGRFLSLNGKSGGSSVLRAGRSYVVPTRWGNATQNEIGAGQRLLVADNARLREAAQRQDFDRHDLWSRAPIDFRPRRIPVSYGARMRRVADVNPAAMAAVGALGWGFGLAPGVVRGGFHTIKGAGEGLYFVSRLTNPLDLLLSAPGQSAAEQVLHAGAQAGDYLRRGVDDPSRVRDDIRAALHRFDVRQNPFATPAADTLGGEFRRTFDIGMNNGELAFDVGSLLLGGEFIRGAAGLGAAAKGAGARELAYLKANPGVAARFELPYSGMGHHILERRTRLPAFLGGGPLPKWLLESEFNKIRENGLTTRDFYRNHNGAAGHFHGSAIPAKFGGGSWSAKDLGWTEYGWLDKLNYGTSPYTKAIVGPALFGGTASEMLDGGASR